jgi:hypothetical protein
MATFNSYVELPEGKLLITHRFYYIINMIITHLQTGKPRNNDDTMGI